LLGLSKVVCFWILPDSCSWFWSTISFYGTCCCWTWPTIWIGRSCDSCYKVFSFSMSTLVSAIGCCCC
jgi:hypothetical protein